MTRRSRLFPFNMTTLPWHQMELSMNVFLPCMTLLWSLAGTRTMWTRNTKSTWRTKAKWTLYVQSRTLLHTGANSLRKYCHSTSLANYETSFTHSELIPNESLVGNHPIRQENEPIRNLSKRNKHPSFQPRSKIQLIYIWMRLFTWFLSVYFANVILQKVNKAQKHQVNASNGVISGFMLYESEKLFFLWLCASGQLVGVDVMAALDMYAERGQWDKCLDTASKQVICLLSPKKSKLLNMKFGL